jgi:hypothetical protein
MTTEVTADPADPTVPHASAAPPLEDEDRLPWLEAVEEDDRGPSPGKLIAAVLIGLVAIGIIVGGLFWLGNRAASGGAEEVIASPGDYKVPAPEPGGMKVDNGSSSQVAASEGAEQTASINQNAQPEAPVNQPQQQPATQAPAPKASRRSPRHSGRSRKPSRSLRPSPSGRRSSAAPPSRSAPIRARKPPMASGRG